MDLKQLVEDLRNTGVSKSRPRWRVWEPFMIKYHLDVICELGVQHGVNFKQLIKHGPKLAVAVDCWTNDIFLGHNDLCYTQEELDKQYEDFKAEMADKPFVKIMREYSYDAVKKFPDAFFDLVYIDADHTYEGVKRDLEDWYPKLKKGGVFCGHDYARKAHNTTKGLLRFGVVEAVNEFAKANNLELFVVPNSTWVLIKP